MAKTLEKPRQEDVTLASVQASIPISSEDMGFASLIAEAPGADAAIQAERKRLQEIDAVAGLFDPALVQEAKYGMTACSAQELTYRAARQAAQKGRKILANLEADTEASGAQSVSAANSSGVTGEGNSPQAMIAQAKADAKAYNERRKEVR